MWVCTRPGPGRGALVLQPGVRMQSKFAGKTIRTRLEAGWGCATADYGLGDQPEDSAERLRRWKNRRGAGMPGLRAGMHTATRAFEEGAEARMCGDSAMLMYLGYDVGARGADGLFGSGRRTGAPVSDGAGLTVDGVVARRHGGADGMRKAKEEESWNGGTSW